MKGQVEFWFYVSVGVGMALATSSFTVLSGLFQVGGGVLVMTAIALAGVFCLLLSLSIAELASMFPSAPGIRTYLKPALGSGASLALVYMYLLFTVLMAGVEGYMLGLVVSLVAPANPAPVALALLAAVTAINLGGYELPRGTQMAITAGAVIILVVAGGVGIRAGAPIAWTAAPLDWRVLPSAIGLAVFLYMGFEWITPVGVRPRSYERQIPRAVWTSVLMLMVVYLLFAWTAVRQVPVTALAAGPLPHVAVYERLFGQSGDLVALALAVAASTSTFNAGVMGGSRLLFMLAREGHVPRWVGAMSANGVPIGATLLLGGSAIAAAILVITFQLQLLLAIVGSAIMCVVYGAFSLAVLILRRTRPTARRPYSTPVPIWLQWAMVVILPLLGVGSLMSLPQLMTEAFACMAGSVVLAVLAARWSLRRTARVEVVPA